MELEINATPLNVSTEDVFENVVELPPIPCNEFQSEQPQGARVSPSKPPAKKEKLTTVVKIFMKACKNAWGLWARKQSMRLAAFIASELDSLPCPKQQSNTSKLSKHSLSV
ncbi:hypothetical protein TNIN_228761 [Trichonephila inaurata madagascariensis]|uniref:Uncharacterized protein n=1 Tax=Trichonephila inaurata madagascariensis TaxID=2747483 RepID=A0A8X7CH72_9ARAC|nr:hypothetical protein TNIN_228761 [Trichonephila inaurata madagascariensis]